MTGPPWWRDAVCYQVYVRSFADADGDGLGDLDGIRQRLPYLRALGVDAVWLTPFYTSPQNDAGYDVADYRQVDARYGTLSSFDAMLTTAHTLGLKVVIDLVPNHTSSEHVWFQQALAAEPDSLARRRYLFADGEGRNGTRPPNNWKSMFGGPAWTRVADGQWYLHLFDSTQPDLNWRNAEVGDEFESILRFWLDRGVDGFRIDVAHGLFKKDGLPDGAFNRYRGPFWNQPEVHDVYRRWHRVLAEYPGDRMAIGEAWVDTAEDMARYVRPDELQQVFNFAWLEAPWSAAAFRRVIEHTYDAVDRSGASPTWVLSNHDVVRAVTRYGGGEPGLARAKAATMAMLALPGSAYLYQGDELGLPQVDVPERARQDPTSLRGGGVGRDGSRVPLPWSGTARPYGFSPEGAAASWLPQPRSWARLSVEAQERDTGSTLHFFRLALAIRRNTIGDLDHRVTVSSPSPGVLALERDPGFVCVVNCGRRARRLATYGDLHASYGDLPLTSHGHPPLTSYGDLPLTSYGDLLLASGEEASVRSGILPPDTAAWFQT